MPRSFASLRPRAVPTLPPVQDEPIERVLRRVFHDSADGQRTLAWLLDKVARPAPLGSPDAVVREQDGARRLVAELADLATPRLPAATD